MRFPFPAGVALAVCLTFAGVTPLARAADEARAIESTITHVTVYPEWAYVIRSAGIELPVGASRLSLESLPAWIDAESIRVSLGKTPGVVIDGVRTETTYLARSTQDEVNAAEQRVTQINDQIEDLSNHLAVLAEEKQYLRDLKVFLVGARPENAAIREVSIEEMAAVQDHLKTQMLENARAITELNRKVRDLRPELAVAQRTFNDLRGRIQLEQKRIVIDLTAAEAVNTTIEVGYLISGASWYPAYDARSSSASGELTLTARAVVQQSTGEDWNQATFTLSTIQPYLSREKPQLKPWVLGRSFDPNAPLNAEMSQRQSPENFRYGNKEAEQRLSQIQSKQYDYNTKNQWAQAAYARVNLNRDNLLRVVRSVEERGTTVEFNVVGKHSVTADGKPSELPLGQATLDTTRHYAATPAVSRSTYITAQMRNTGQFPVLPGEVRIYTDGSFVAKSTLPFVAQNERFELFLGLEERIKVTRELDYTRSSTGTWSNKKRLSAAYVIEVRNFHDTPITIDVADQVPVSEDKEISVRVETIDPAAGSVDKGIITWPVKLGPGEAKTLRFAFRIEYPPNAVVLPAAVQELQMQIEAK